MEQPNQKGTQGHSIKLIPEEIREHISDSEQAA